MCIFYVFFYLSMFVFLLWLMVSTMPFPTFVVHINKLRLCFQMCPYESLFNKPINYAISLINVKGSSVMLLFRNAEMRTLKPTCLWKPTFCFVGCIQLIGDVCLHIKCSLVSVYITYTEQYSGKYYMDNKFQKSVFGGFFFFQLLLSFFHSLLRDGVR